MKMALVTNFEELKCWKAARLLSSQVFLATEKGKISREWDTRSQLRRAALSIMNNIAEGFGRTSRKEFIRYLEIASGSANEVKSMLYLLDDVSLLENETIKELKTQIEETQKLTKGLIAYLKTKQP